MQGVFIYWCTSNVFSLVQSLLFKLPAVRSFLNLPDLAKLRAIAAGQPTEHVGKPVVTFAQKPKQAQPTEVVGRPVVTFAQKPKKAEPTETVGKPVVTFAQKPKKAKARP